MDAFMRSDMDSRGMPNRGWIIDWSGSGASFPIEIHATGAIPGYESTYPGRVYSITPPGSGIGYMRSGTWQTWWTGITADTVSDAPILAVGAVTRRPCISYDGTGSQGRLAFLSYTSGTPDTPTGCGSQLQGFSLSVLSGYFYWHQWYSSVGTYTGAIADEAAIDWNKIVGNRGRAFAEEDLNGITFNATGIWSGTPGGVLTNTGIAAAGSGFVGTYVRQPCVYSGVAYAMAGSSIDGYKHIWKMNTPGSGWILASSGFTLQSTPASYGTCTALNGCIYTCTTTGSSTLNIWKYTIADGTVVLDASMDISAWAVTAESANGHYSYFTNDGASVYLACYGYVFRKDVL